MVARFLWLLSIFVTVGWGCSNGDSPLVPKGRSSANASRDSAEANARSVTYDTNRATAGEAPRDTTVYEAGQTVKIRGNPGVLSKTGFTFAGWNTAADGNGTNYVENSTLVMGSVNIVLYAKWTERPTFQITYDGNGHTGGAVPVDANNYEEGQQVVVKGNSQGLTKEGSTFAGWTSQADGGGASYVENASLLMAAADLTLFAKWTTNPTFQVTYKTNDATSGTVPSDPNNYETGDMVTVMPNSGGLKRRGYTFAGWSTTADGSGITRQPQGTFAMESSAIILYAKWVQAPTYRVVYDKNATTVKGAVPVDPNNYLEGDQVTVRPHGSLANEGYNFGGWDTKADGSGLDYSQGGNFVIGTSNITLYAKWTLEPTYRVRYQSAGSVQGLLPSYPGTFRRGQSITIPPNDGNVRRDGFTFVGWNSRADGTGTAFNPGETYTVQGETIFYAYWTKQPTFTVIYSDSSKTSGTVPIGVTRYQTGRSIKILPNRGELTRIGYSFAGWNTKADGTGTDYQPNSTFVVGTQNVTFYPKWFPVAPQKVVYDRNGGTGTVPSEAVHHNGVMVTVMPNHGVLKKVGSIFVGWNTQSDGKGTTYTQGQQFKMGANPVTLYALWTNAATIVVGFSTHSSSYKVAGYWINGTWISLVQGTPRANSEAQSVTISGSDIYIGGYRGSDSGGQTWIPGYWRNGQWTSLFTAPCTKNQRSRVGGIVVRDGKIIVGGSCEGSGELYLPMEWTVDTRTNAITAKQLPVNDQGNTDTGLVSFISFKNSHLIGAGWNNDKRQFDTYAPMFWIDGVRQSLEGYVATNNDAEIKTLAVSDSTVYAGGYACCVKDHEEYDKDYPLYWIFEKASSGWQPSVQKLEVPDKSKMAAGVSITGMAVSPDSRNVYAASDYPELGYWHNGKWIANDLKVGGKGMSCHVSTLKYVAAKLYAAGKCSDEENYTDYLVHWFNGDRKAAALPLLDPNASAEILDMAIFGTP